ncbi:MAG TPA: hypothetical protein PLP17_11115 [Oligoflexia bacterium]|nr:hypothetical protein [Oligoflexia bacterium]
MEQDELRSLVRDLKSIRQAVDEAGIKQLAPGAMLSRSRLHFAIHLTAAVLVLLLILADCFLRIGPTQFLIQTHFHFPLRFSAIGIIGLLLIFLCGVLYAALAVMAKREGEALEDYLARNLPYLMTIPFLSDLSVKFAAVSLLILAGRPDWVAPMFLIFIGDYLLQGRFFVLPLRLAWILGAASLIVGVLQCLLWYGTLLLPFGVFVSLSFLSLLHLGDLRSKNESQA